MDISWDNGDGTVIVFEDEELENAIRVIETILVLYSGCDMSQVLPILAMMRAEAENRRRATGRQGHDVTITYH